MKEAHIYVDEDGNEYTENNDFDDNIQNSNDNQNWEWEYVEEIDGNTCIYTSDSYNKKLTPAELSPIYKGCNINLTVLPQIYDESNEGEIGDPYKNSILKD